MAAVAMAEGSCPCCRELDVIQLELELLTAHRIGLNGRQGSSPARSTSRHSVYHVRYDIGIGWGLLVGMISLLDSHRLRSAILVGP